MVEKPNLDLLRCIAVTLVVVGHTLMSKGIEQWGRFHMGDIGLFGVYLFFVHTSLVLMWSLERRPNTLDFYIRRIFRLYPLAVLAILFAAATHAPVAGYTGHYFNANPFTWTSLLINCLFLQDLVGYAPIIHGVTWSLSPELYMYILLPCLFVYARFMKTLWPLLLFWLLAVLFAYRIFPIQLGNSFPVLIPDFLSGIIAYVGFMRRRATLPAWVLLPLLAILFAVFMTVRHLRMDWYACLTLALLLPSIRQMDAKLPRVLAHILAKYSFGIYLFHPFTIVLGMYLLSGRPIVVQLMAEILPLAAVAWAGYHLVEAPMIRFGASVAAKLAKERGLPSPESLVDLEPAP